MDGLTFLDGYEIYQSCLEGGVARTVVPPLVCHLPSPKFATGFLLPPSPVAKGEPWRQAFLR